MSEIVRKKVGLALGGGVVRGLAHIGVLLELEKAMIPIDYLAATSAGSLIGTFICAGWNAEQIYKFALKLRWQHIARPCWPRRGLISFQKLARMLVTQLGDLDFSELKIPFTVVATDMERGCQVILNRGRVAPAVQASCSVPGIVAPVELDGRILSDGSLVNTLPVSLLYSMGAEYVIGIDIFSPKHRPKWGPLGYGLTAIEILVDRAGGGIEQADCLIVPNLAGMTYLRFSKLEDFFQLGRQATTQQINQIRTDLCL